MNKAPGNSGSGNTGPGNARVSYWDAKIRRWAKSCYSDRRTDLMSKLRGSIDARKEETKKLLSTYMKPGYTLVDLGCGAGQLVLESVRDGGARHGLGRDFSPEAIRFAEELRETMGISRDQARFEVAGVDASLPPADVITGLGLLDWLDPDQIDGLFGRLTGRRFILSYSELDYSPSELVHRLYLVWRLRILGHGVRAYHHPRKFILGLVEKHGLGPVEIVSSPKMRFGRLVHNLTGLRP